LVGRFANGGQEFQPKGEPEEVKHLRLPSLAEGKAIPYGVYDVGDNSGWVAVGVDHDTAAFAVATIGRWWQQVGRRRVQQLSQPDMEVELAKLAAETGLEITVCHLPPGTSKWNKIEHRLFSHISMNWGDGRWKATRSLSGPSRRPRPAKG